MIKTFVNNEERNDLFTLMNFPGGEPHAKLNRSVANIGDKINIILKGSDLNEYAQVLMMVNLLKQYNVVPGVFVPYLAGARADHDATQGWYPYAMLASQFPNLHIADIHSQEHTSFFGDNLNVYRAGFIAQSIAQNYDVIVAPDRGAEKRALSVSHANQSIVFMEKVRDQESGWIVKYGFSRNSDANLRGKKALVVDDICDGGMTFKLLAEAFEGLGVTQLDLYVTHGIFSGNAKENLAGYDNIYTTNSLETASRVDATIIDIERIYLDDSGPVPD